MILAHVAGVPFEEWVEPLVAGGAGIALAVHGTLLRLRRRARDAAGYDDGACSGRR